MLRKCSAVASLTVLMLVVGCAKASRSVSSPSLPQVTGFAGSPERFLAIRHKLEVIAPESGLPEAWESVITFCGTIQCEVMSLAAGTLDEMAFAAWMRANVKGQRGP